MSKNLIVLSYRINYFKTSAIDTTFSQKFQQNLGDNLLKVGKKNNVLTKIKVKK